MQPNAKIKKLLDKNKQELMELNDYYAGKEPPYDFHKCSVEFRVLTIVTRLCQIVESQYDN